MKILLTSLVLFLSLNIGRTHAQVVDKAQLAGFYNTWSGSVTTGLIIGYTDIKQYSFAPVRRELKAGLNLALQKQLNPYWSIRGSLLTGECAGKNSAMNSYYQASVTAYSASLALNLTNLIKNYRCPNTIIYAASGIGITDFRTIKRELVSDEFIFAYGYSKEGRKYGGATSEMVLPFTLGAKYKYSENIDFTVETTLFCLNADKLDAEILPYSGNDKFEYTSVGLSYRFGDAKHYMEWLRPGEKEKLDQFLIETNDLLLIRDTFLSIFYEKNEYAVSLEKQVEIVSVVKELNQHPSAKITVVGYYDINGEDKYVNKNSLANLRAEAVIDLLKSKYKIAPERITKRKIESISDYELSKQAVPGNRRVDFIILGISK